MNSNDWHRRACAVIPGGVNSPVRAFRSVGGSPFFVASAEGPYIHTVDGKRLVDWVGSWGPMVLGHAHPAVLDALRSALSAGTSFGACSPAEVLLAEEIAARVPSIERVRLTSSGTEATMSAVRLARGFTGRAGLIKFRGCYHGHGDSFLISAGSGALTFGNPSSPGVTAGTAADTLLADFNDIASVEACFRARPGGIAALIVEPVPGNMGVVPPAPGFLEALRDLCTREGALLIFDEVMTGFRLSRGGAQQVFAIRPDLTTLGKIAGGGLPLAAFGGRADIMDHLSPLGPVYQAGTLSGNPLACFAGLTQLRLLDDAVYTRLEGLGARLEARLGAVLAGRDDVVLQRAGSMATVFFHRGPVRGFAEVEACDSARFARLFRHLLDRGHYLPPSQFEAFFLSTAHEEHLIDELVEGIATFLATDSPAG